MARVVTRTGKGAAITQSENDSNLDSFCGINESQTGTTYTVDEDDQNNIIELLNASTVTVTLTLISTLISAIDTSDFSVTLKNIGAGSVVVTPTTDTFDDDDATKTLAQYEWLTIQTNNAQDKWNVIASSDASKVDGLDASQFLRSDENDTTVGNLTVEKSDATIILNSTGNNATVTTNDSGVLRSSAGWVRTDDRYQIDMYDTDGLTPRARMTLTELGKVNIAIGDLQIQSTGLLDLIYPVGAIYMSTENVSPSSILGGVWGTIRTGKVLVSENATYSAGSTYGSNTQAVHSHSNGSLTADVQIGFDLCDPGAAVFAAPFNHTHDISGSTSNNSAVTNDNMQQSLAVYMWERTA